MASQKDSTDQHPKSLQLRDLKIGQKIGKGGFSKVYEAEWMNTPCVIKRFRKSETDISCDNILEEGHTWNNLKHPNITLLYEIITEEGSKLPSFLLERMDTSLGKHLAKTKEIKETTFPFASKFKVLLQVSRGLLYLHQRSLGLIHGDLTANNVLLRIKGQEIEAKISDFGMSRVAEGSDRRCGTTTVRGVEGYMAPEVKNGSPELASDVYSFGVLTIHTCTHDLPAPKYPMEVRDGKEIILNEMERFDLEFSKLSDGDEQFCLSLVGQCLHRVPSGRLTAKTLLEKMLELRKTVPELETEDEASGRPQSINYNVFSLIGNNISGSDLSLDISRLSKQHRPEIQLPSAKRKAIQDDGKSDSKEEGYSSREDREESYNPSIPDSEATSENETENDKSDSKFEEEGNSKSEDEDPVQIMTWMDSPKPPGKLRSVAILGGHLYAACYSATGGNKIFRLNIETLNWEENYICNIPYEDFTLAASQSSLFRVSGHRVEEVTYEEFGTSQIEFEKVPAENTVSTLDLSQGVNFTDWKGLPDMNYSYDTPQAICFEDYLVVAGYGKLEIINTVKKQAWVKVELPPVAQTPYLALFESYLYCGPTNHKSISFKQHQNEAFQFPIESLKTAADNLSELMFTDWHRCWPYGANYCMAFGFHDMLLHFGRNTESFVSCEKNNEVKVMGLSPDIFEHLFKGFHGVDYLPSIAGTTLNGNYKIFVLNEYKASFAIGTIRLHD